MPVADLDRARQFLAAKGRVLDRRRFECLFEAGDAGRVRDAVAAYRNPDGGFGHALEPDGRAPGSQPASVELALRTLDGADAWDDELVAGACDWLERTAPAAGGTTFVDPGIEGWPHAPWWRPVEGLPPSLTITGQIAGTLHARAVEHPWLDRATALLWSLVDDAIGARGESLEGVGGGYEMRGAIAFLEHVPDRDRAEAALASLAPILVDRNLVELDPDVSGELQRPLELAPLPGARARGLFDPATIDSHLDHLAAAQEADGGWTFGWPAWSPVAEAEWRGSVTVDALSVLRANDRL